MAPGSWTEAEDGQTYHRKFGLSESALYPASLQDGLGDMFLHLELSLPEDLISEDRFILAWAVLRARHPVLASEVVDGGLRYTKRSVPEALESARGSFSHSTASKDELIHHHMNGPRALSDTHLSHLTLTPTSIFLTAPHFIGDGTSLHTTTQEFLILLSTPPSPSQLQEELDRGIATAGLDLESQLPRPTGRLQPAVQKVEYQLRQTKDIGGHTLPRKAGTSASTRRTVIKEISYDPQRTREIIAVCKSHGVSISNVMFALVAIAWTRVKRESTGQGSTDPASFALPILIYTAQNLRPYLPSRPSMSNWFLALGYFNVVLPSYPPSDLLSGIWRRATSARAQSISSTSSPLLLSRSLCGSQQRHSRSTSTPYPLAVSTTTPSAALCGVSLIGNLDKVYVQEGVDKRIRLESVTTASKQRAGGFLLLEHTFRERLWLHLAWDEMGFEEGVVEAWWEELQRIMDIAFPVTKV